MLTGVPPAEAEGAQKGKTEVGSEVCGIDPRKPKCRAWRHIGAVAQSPGSESWLASWVTLGDWPVHPVCLLLDPVMKLRQEFR